MKKISSSISLSSGSTLGASRLLTGGWKALELPRGVGLRILNSQGSLGRGRRLSEEMGLMASSMSMRDVSYLEGMGQRGHKCGTSDKKNMWTDFVQLNHSSNIAELKRSTAAEPFASSSVEPKQGGTR